MTYVTVERLSFTYPSARTPVIRALSFIMERGEIAGVLGASGSGKSTLLRIVAGLEAADEGRVAIGGRTVLEGRTFVTPEQRGVGMVFQDYALFPHLTVGKNIAFGLHRLPRTERAERVREMLELVHLTGFEGRYPHELSGGQQQRVALARALAPRPALLLMDEPFSNLDAELRASIRDELRDILKRAETTCLLVTHDRQDVEAICDRVIHIESAAPQPVG